MENTNSKQFKSATELKREMVDVAMKVMTNFQSDIVYDLEKVDELAQRKRDGWFYWAVRKMGTHTRSTCKEFDELRAAWGKDIIFGALIGRSVEKGIYEITYTK